MRYFDYEFEYFPERGLQDLETLESEGCVFAQFWFEELDEFRYCRVPFKPPEIVEYVEAAKAYEEYLHYTDSGCSGREALNKISNSKARERVIEDPRVDTQRESFSFANFMTADLESLTSGHEKERYQFVDEDRSLDNRAILRKVTQNLETSVHALQNRYGNRPPFEIADEQDIHDLLYAIIKPIFLDTRTEEYTPKHAGSSKRVDIVIPQISTGIELKYVRNETHGKNVADELKIDIGSYHAHENCNNLIIIIWDPDSFIHDRHNIKADIEGPRTIDGKKIEVEVEIF